MLLVLFLSYLHRAIRRNNANAIATTNIADIPPDMVNPGAVELVLDIRREYTRKLQESQERARKLRADLAVEEHRGQELSRILKEILPDPKTSAPQRPRLGRRTSNERKKMSKRLTDEAMAYFDECVSISTFDSSDFSAPEDPPPASVGATVTVGGIASLPRGSPSISTSSCSKSCLNRKQESGVHGQLMDGREDSGLTASSSSNDPLMDPASQRSTNTERIRKQFSFGCRSNEVIGLQQDIRSYITHFGKDIDKDGINSESTRSNYYDADEYNFQGHAEGLLFDRVFLHSRMESGSLHLCGGGFAISFSPFASFI
ncbi:unnamed protein product [Ilex paraguariensis]|uniref:Uncharacterized protein n=1 Tax=Ilex paraguariensis TaxID=185542 RepID=A0ABC8SQN3_9AQUA